MVADPQYGTMEEVLLGVRQLLLANVTWLSADTVFISDEPQTDGAVPMDVWVVVTPSPDEMFDAAAAIGGGNDQLTVSTRVFVTVHTAAHFADQPNRSAEFFAGTNIPSINRLRRDILQAISHRMIYRSDNSPVLNEPIRPAQGAWTRSKSGGSWQGGFDVEFDEHMEDAANFDDATLPGEDP